MSVKVIKQVKDKKTMQIQSASRIINEFMSNLSSSMKNPSIKTFTLSYLQKKLSSGGGDIPKAGFKSWGRRFLLRVAFALPTLKFKAPQYLGDLPESSDFNDLNKRFATQRADLKAFLDTMSNDLLEGEVWKHARAGKMSIAQMLDFFEDHFDRHERQLKKAIGK